MSEVRGEMPSVTCLTQVPLQETSTLYKGYKETFGFQSHWGLITCEKVQGKIDDRSESYSNTGQEVMLLDQSFWSVFPTKPNPQSCWQSQNHSTNPCHLLINGGLKVPRKMKLSNTFWAIYKRHALTNSESTCPNEIHSFQCRVAVFLGESQKTCKKVQGKIENRFESDNLNQRTFLD